MKFSKKLNIFLFIENTDYIIKKLHFSFLKPTPLSHDLPIPNHVFWNEL